MNNQNANIHSEFIIQRLGQGIKLIEPKQAHLTNKSVTIESLLNKAFHVYFVDKNSITKEINESTAKAFNLASIKDGIGITVREIANKESAEACLMVDRHVIDNNKMMMTDDMVVRLDGVSFPMLTIKFPWYDRDNEVIGVFGFSIRVDKKGSTSLAESMNLITQTGLLQPTSMQNHSFPGLILEDDYFTRRQKDILLQIIRGKTAKDTASILAISQRTVEKHLEHLKIKMRVSTKSELIEKLMAPADKPSSTP